MRRRPEEGGSWGGDYKKNQPERPEQREIFLFYLIFIYNFVTEGSAIFQKNKYIVFMEDSRSSIFTNIFLEQIKGMNDRDLLSAYSRKEEYDPLFCSLAEEELAIRGYNIPEITADNVDILVIHNKTTDTLVDIFINDDQYINGWKELAKEELKSRGFDISSLYATDKKGREILKNGVKGRFILLGYICAIFIGLVGLTIGLNFRFNKWTSVNGERFYKYNKYTRIHGTIISIIAIVFIIMKNIIELRKHVYY